jgi:hypothetical protein
MAISKMEIINGKLSTAISTLLLFALDDIPDMNVNEVEKPIDESNIVAKKITLSEIGSKIKSEKRK